MSETEALWTRYDEVKVHFVAELIQRWNREVAITNWNISTPRGQITGNAQDKLIGCIFGYKTPTQVEDIHIKVLMHQSYKLFHRVKSATSLFLQS